ALLKALDDAGFTRDEAQVFLGKAGEARLDLKGEHHGPWVRLRRLLQHTFSDDAEILDRAEEALEHGGLVASVPTGNDEARKTRAAEVLHAHGGKALWYWGDMVTEGL